MQTAAGQRPLNTALGPVFNLRRWLRHRRLKRSWDSVIPGMTVVDAEKLMGFVFRKDSENIAGRIVYSNHEHDDLPFYLVVDRTTGLIVRRHNIRALDELSSGA